MSNDQPGDMLTVARLAWHKSPSPPFVYGQDGEVIGGAFVAALEAARPLIEAPLLERIEEAEAVAKMTEDYVRDEVPQQLEDARAEGAEAERKRIASRLRERGNELMGTDGREQLGCGADAEELWKQADLLDGDAEPPCYCAETSTRNCPAHQNGDER